MKFQLLLAAVNPKLTYEIIDIARALGATGATIVPGRGIGGEDKKTFFGLTMEGETDVILFVMEEKIAEAVIKALDNDPKFQASQSGIAFTIPIDQIAGIQSQLEKFKKANED